MAMPVHVPLLLSQAPSSSLFPPTLLQSSGLSLAANSGGRGHGVKGFETLVTQSCLLRRTRIEPSQWRRDDLGDHRRALSSLHIPSLSLSLSGGSWRRGLR